MIATTIEGIMSHSDLKLCVSNTRRKGKMRVTRQKGQLQGCRHVRSSQNLVVFS